jgi:hypothetical protein
MDYQEILTKCEDIAVGNAVFHSLVELFSKDSQLLKVNASERAIAAAIAQYLRPHFEGYHVDVEYNRMGEAPKKVAWSKNLDDVYPDIIVHKRMTATNVVVIELKKDTNPEKKEKDIKKLRAYRRELGYCHALFIRLGVGDKAGIVSECEWVGDQ